ncbi:methylmalonyl-CoA mutase family protein, partial [Arthrospira platensis SPKY1]|nr:methylmalonyl-CoA mutase family protein [Arthrospira platensis SPKY1]
DNEFGNRIARNQLLILKHESYFDEVSNAVDGAYFIEDVTKQIAENALALLKEMDANGGWITQLMEGTPQRKIRESEEKEQEWFDAGKIVRLGTNKYPNPQDRMKNDLELYP